MRRRRSNIKQQRIRPRVFSHRMTPIIVIICLFFAQAAIAATGTVNYNTVHQQLEGFGGAACYDMQTLAGHPDSDAVYNLLFRELGLDVLRIKNTYQINSGDVSATGSIVAAGKSRNPALKTQLVPWSPKASLKSDGTLGGLNSTLKKDAADPNNSSPYYYVYNEYAKWWQNSLIGPGGYFDAGVYPDYISIQNEPDWGEQDQVCRFLPTENPTYAGYDRAFEAVFNKMDVNVSPMPKILAPETAGLGITGSYITELNDIGQLGNIYGFSHHLYDITYTDPDVGISAMQSFKNSYGYKPLFMTEYGAEGTPTFTHAVLLAQHIYNTLVYENLTSYYHWSLFRNGGYNDGGMINLTPGGGYIIRDLYWFFKHYTYFTDPNWFRVGTSTTSSNLRMTAFKDPDGSRLTIVILNKSTSSENLTLTINNFPPSGSILFTEVYRSSQTENWSYIGTFDPAQALTLPAQSITTISMADCPTSSRWKPLNSGMDAPVWALNVYNGELIAGGEFTIAGGTGANYIARWDGSSWQSLGDGMDSWVLTLTVYNGELIAGGWFVTAGGTGASYIARWDGSSWQPVGDGPYDVVFALTVYQGELIAGGWFGIAQWDGSSWQPLGDGVDNVVNALTVHNGELIAGGDFGSAGGIGASKIARWNGSAWQPMGDGMNTQVFALAVYNGELIAGGEFTTAGGIDANYIARWDGADWQPMGNGMNSPVSALAVYNGNLIAGGGFITAGGSAANRIARWDGSTWQPIGGGMDNGVNGLTVYNGELAAGGGFTNAGGIPAARVARWGLPVIFTGDLNHDCVVNWLDLDRLADKWLDDDCMYNGWCYEADLNYDFIVNFEDFAGIGNNWLNEP